MAAGGIFGSIGKIVGGVAKIAKVGLPVLKSLPGIGTAVSVAGLVAGGVGKIAGLRKGAAAVSAAKSIVPYSPAFAASQIGRAGLARGLGIGAGAAALGAGAVSMLGGGARRRYRRMNPLNHRAATRAVKRIKAVRKLCRSIESSLPKQRSATCAPRFKRRAA